MRYIALIIVSFLLNGCLADPSQTPINPIRKVDSIQRLTDTVTSPFVKHPSPDSYTICHGHTCAKFAQISLSPIQWQAVSDLFSPFALDPDHEQQLIKQAIALLENYSGKQSGTSIDRAKNDISLGFSGQLDCIDEATNTTVYLRLLTDASLLKFYQQSYRTSRGGLIRPHNTATIIEHDSGIRYAVDSWFYANGVEPVIIPLDQWKSGWKPTSNN